MDREEFLADRRTIDAVIRNFELIGEAASRLPLDFRHEHSKIDWRILIDFRNRLIHAYFGLDFLIIWNVAVQHLPDLKRQLRALLSTLD